MLIAVAYVHILLDPAAALLAVADVVRPLARRSGVRGEGAGRSMVIHGCPEVMVVDRRSANDVDRRPGCRVS